MTEMKINQLPVRTWNWLGMNESLLKGRDLQLLESAAAEKAVILSAKPEEQIHRAFCFSCGEGETTSQAVELTAEAGSALTVWMEISSERDAEGFFALATKIKAGRLAKVRLVQVQLLGEKYRFFNDIQAECGEGAGVELIQLFLGGAKTWAAFHSSLDGAESSVSAELGYWLRADQRLDLNYVTLHKEEKTKSQILAKGVLDEEAFKLFRGTIDFQTGSAGSEGAETEEVLMLGENAVNQTIPLILCAEEDVQGSHGATVGAPDEDVLFYLVSRGMEKPAAVNLLARSRIEALSARIGNEALEEKVHEYLEEMTQHAG